MPLQLPNLDNKTFDDLMKEMIASIPKYTREWTNFNPSDVGITILELLAWISETLIYRANNIPESSYINFLKLIAGISDKENITDINNCVYDQTDNAHKNIIQYVKDIVDGKVKPEVQSMKAEAQKFLTSKYRAVTEDDFEVLAIEASPKDIKRVIAKVSSDEFGSIRIEIILVTEPEGMKQEDVSKLITKVHDYLNVRKLVGNIWLDVKVAEYTDIALKINLFCESYARRDDIEKAVTEAITAYLDSVTGGPDGNGWPYSRSLMVYELFHIIEKINGVKYIDEILEQGSAKEKIDISGLVRLGKITVSINEEK